MLLKANALLKSQVVANDGEVGSLTDIYFDDTQWAARYLVVETGRWLDRRQVLVSPASLHRDRGEVGIVHADLSREQIRNCPDIDTDRPVSRRYEIAHARYYGYAGYWTGSLLWGSLPYPGVMAPASVRDGTVMPAALPADRDAAREDLEAAERSHLRSAKELIGYRVEASDGDAGDLDDLAIDDQDWSIRYLIVDAKRWWPGGLVMVRPSEVQGIHYDGAMLKLRTSKQALRDSPPVD